MTTTIPAKITIAIGERTIEVTLKDARSLGFLDNGAIRQVEDMYDGDGNLLDPEDTPFAEDLIEISHAARSGWTSAVEGNRPQE